MLQHTFPITCSCVLFCRIPKQVMHGTSSLKEISSALIYPAYKRI